MLWNTHDASVTIFNISHLTIKVTLVESTAYTSNVEALVELCRAEKAFSSSSSSPASSAVLCRDRYLHVSNSRLQFVEGISVSFPKDIFFIYRVVVFIYLLTYISSSHLSWFIRP